MITNYFLTPQQSHVITDLTSTPRKILEDKDYDDVPVTSHKALIRETAQMGSKFEEVFLKFADTHYAINHSKALTQDNLKSIGKYTIKSLVLLINIKHKCI